MTGTDNSWESWLARPARQGALNALALLAPLEPCDPQLALASVLQSLRDGDGAWVHEPSAEQVQVPLVIAVVLVGVQGLPNAAEVAHRLLDRLPWEDARVGVTLVGSDEGSESARRRAEGALLLALDPGPRVATSPPLGHGR